MVVFKSSKWEAGEINQYIAAFSGSIGYTLSGLSIAWPSPTLVEIADHEAPLFLNISQESWMVSLMFIGHLSVPVPVGYLMDWLGRKRSCLLMAVLPLCSWLLIIFGKTAVCLYIARFLAGNWIGTITTVMPLYVGEISEPGLRSSLVTTNNLLSNFGLLFIYLLGSYVSYQTLAIACEVVTLVFICTFAFMPESPYFLLKTNRREDAVSSLTWFRKGKSLEYIEKEIKGIEETLEGKKAQRGTLKDIFTDPGNKKALIIALTYSCFRRLSGSGVLQAYASVTLPPTTMGFLDPDTCVIIIGMVSLISSIISTALSVRYKCRILMTVSCVGCTLPAVVIMVWFYLNRFTSVEVTKYSDVIFWSMIVYFVAYNIGLGPIGTSIKGEIFTPQVKGLSSSIITLATALSGFVVNKYYLLIAKSFGMYLNYLFFSLACVVVIVFTWTYVPEIHNKTLEEIQQVLSERKSHKSIILDSNPR